MKSNLAVKTNTGNSEIIFKHLYLFIRWTLSFYSIPPFLVFKVLEPKAIYMDLIITQTNYDTNLEIIFLYVKVSWGCNIKIFKNSVESVTLLFH